MNTRERRNEIIRILSENTEPVSASRLAGILSVSRQVIVGDVALLRAEEHDIRATVRGYILNKQAGYPFTGRIVCNHKASQMEEELCIIVDFGGTCIDVSVDHAYFGEITGKLDIASRYDIALFLDAVKKDNRPLSELSGGIHLHRIGCADREIFELICEKLEEKGFIYR